MSRRIDVELTSDRGDGTWSWRAAGARQPKGVLDATLLYDGARVGDVVRAEADFDIEGITVIGLQAPKGARKAAESIEVRGVEKEFTPVTSSLTGKARERAERGEDDRPRRSRDDRGPRPGGAGGPGGRPGGRPGGPPRGDGDRGPRPGGDRPERPSRPAPPPPKPKAKKLRPARVHRDALVASLSPEQQPIAEQLLRGGMPAVRVAVDEQNAKAKAEDGLEIPVDTVLGIAEQLVTRTRVADWLDRAEAAKATGDELALRDLRSVVSSADDVARDDTTRELAAELKTMLEQRTEAEQGEWLSDIGGSLAGGRVVRALRLSSRPPEPGTSFPAELTTRLTEAANGALTADIAADRWATVLDAVAYSPVRRSVVPAGIPAEPTEELLVAVRKHAGRTPAIAILFGIEPPPDKAKGAQRSTKSAGRNPNLSRAGGSRAATVPVPGRPGGPPIAPAKRIPPPPGRQIGATLPGTPPPGGNPPPPPPAPRQAPDPTAPLTPPSATGVHEAVASVGTPEATVADLEPSTSTPQPAASEPATTSETVPVVTESTAPVTSEAAPAPTDAPTPAQPAEGLAPDAAVPPTAPEAEMVLDAAPTLMDGPGPEVTAPLAAAAFGSSPDVREAASDGPVAADQGSAGGSPLGTAPPAAPATHMTAGAPPADAPTASTDPLTSPASEAAPAAAPTDPTGTTPPADAPTAPTDPVAAPASEAAPAAAPTDAMGATPPADVPAPTDPLAAPASEATPAAPTPAAAPTGGTDTAPPAEAPAASMTDASPAVDVVAGAPADSSLPDPAPTAGATPSTEVTKDEQVADRDAVVSQAAGGPFEPPADPPVEDAANSGTGSVAAGGAADDATPDGEPTAP